MSRAQWIACQAFTVTAWALIVAAITGNPDWPLNIPLGLIVGALWGLASWPITRLIQRWRDKPDQPTTTP